VDRNDNLCNSKPCKGCTKYLERKKIKKVYYSVWAVNQTQNTKNK